jgi:colanic acid/amylovoran biosynthesis protein WcaK/AmsJ
MKKSKLTVLCAGAYGIENAGDDLPLIGLCEGMGRLLPDHQLDFRALSRHPDPWEEKTYGVTMVQNPEYPSGAEAAGRWFRGLNPGDDPKIFEGLRREIREADLLVLGAGNALLDQTIDVLRGPVPLMSVYGFLAALYHTPLMIYGMSVGPLRTEWGRDLSRGLLESAQVVTVRDQSSVSLIASLAEKCPGTVPAVHLLPDPAMAATLPPVGRGQEILAAEHLTFPSDKPLIAIGLRELSRPLGQKENDRLEDSVVGMMDELSPEASFLFVPQSTYREDDDRVLARRLISRTKAHCQLIENRQHPADLIALYRMAQVTLAGRLHAAVFSALALVPVVGIDYLPKVSGFLDNVPGAGRVVSVKDLSSGKLVTELRSLLAMSDGERGNFAERVGNLSVLAKEHAALAVRQGLGL